MKIEHQNKEEKDHTEGHCLAERVMHILKLYKRDIKQKRPSVALLNILLSYKDYQLSTQSSQIQNSHVSVI